MQGTWNLQQPLDLDVHHSTYIVKNLLGGVATQVKNLDLGNTSYTLPVVPHKAVAEVSEKETYRRVWLLRITDGRVNPLMDQTVVGFVFVGVVAMVAVVTSLTTAGCSVVYCSCTCSCSVVEL